MSTAWGGRLSKRFCKHFSDSSTGCWASTAAAMLPKQSKGNSQKFVYKTFYSTCRPTLYCVYNSLSKVLGSDRGPGLDARTEPAVLGSLKTVVLEKHLDKL